MEDVDKRRRFFPGYKRTNVCENIELITVVIIQGESKKSDDCDMYNRNVIPCGV